jgi:acetyltransferase-like isoleucine patch superfamily enzyme
MYVIHRIFDALRSVRRRIGSYIYSHSFAASGRRVFVDPDGYYTPRNIYLGDDVNLGVQPIIFAGMSEIHIGNGVMFGPRVMIFGGGHETRIVGKRMFDVEEKLPGIDLGVRIEDDVWVGAGAIILRGVVIGRGSVIGAGSVVTRSVPEYSIAVGNPARVVKARFSDDDLAVHKKLLDAAGR